MSPNPNDDELLNRLQDAERARRAKAMVIGAIVAVVAIGGLILSFVFKDKVFRPELDVSKGEKNVISDTNDPQCRGFIADITVIGADYAALEPRLTDNMLGDDPVVIQGLIDELDGLRTRIAAARETSKEAALRFDNSRAELSEWFRYIDNELMLLQRVGTDRIAELAAANAPPDAGTVVEDPKAPEKSKMPMPERLSGATLAANEAFQKFRVWHTGGLHPCGPADEGETPWAPQAK